MNDRHQLAKGLAELRSELDQLVALLLGHRHPLGQFRAEDFVLDLEVADLRGQLFLRRTGDQQQQGVVQILIAVKCRRRWYDGR